MSGGYQRNARRMRVRSKWDDRARGFQPSPYPRTFCPRPRQEGDEYVCSRCRLRWDVHEDKPPCNSN